jgi:hypothetical protein
MKFSDLFEEILNEGKNFTDEKFDRYADNAGMWLFEIFIDNISKVTTMPGYLEYKDYVTKNSKYTPKELGNLDNLVMTLPDYYKYFINEIDYKLSNRIMGKTISIFNLGDKMSGRDNSAPMKRGRKPKVQDFEPQGDDSMAHFDQSVEKKRRGRPSVPDELKKKYIPTGLPRGRRPKVAEPEPEFTLGPTDEPITKQRGGARAGAGRPRKFGEPSSQPLQEPLKKMRGRPSKESTYEPEMQSSKIKTLEDRIASLEALLREKGILQENRTLLEGRLRMMKDYQKFL